MRKYPCLEGVISWIFCPFFTHLLSVSQTCIWSPCEKAWQTEGIGKGRENFYHPSTELGPQLKCGTSLCCNRIIYGQEQRILQWPAVEYPLACWSKNATDHGTEGSPWSHWMKLDKTSTWIPYFCNSSEFSRFWAILCSSESEKNSSLDQRPSKLVCTLMQKVYMNNKLCNEKQKKVENSR